MFDFFLYKSISSFAIFSNDYIRYYCITYHVHERGKSMSFTSLDKKSHTEIISKYGGNECVSQEKYVIEEKKEKRTSPSFIFVVANGEGVTQQVRNKPYYEIRMVGRK